MIHSHFTTSTHTYKKTFSCNYQRKEAKNHAELHAPDS